MSRYVANTTWLFAERILRIVYGLVIGIWVARYLGPEDLGVLSYCVALVGLLVPIAKLGLDGFVVRDLVREDHARRQEILGTIAIVKALGSLVLLAASVVGILVLRGDDHIAVTIVVVVGISHLARSTELVEFWFRSQVQAKWIAISQIAGLVTSGAVTVGLILSDAAVVWFAVPILLDALASGASLLVLYGATGGRFSAWKPRLAVAKSMITEAWPMLFSSACAIVYLQIDQVMIEWYLSDKQVGIYSAVVRISTAWYFIPILLCQSLQPAIVKAREENSALYFQRLQEMFTALAGLAYIIAIPVSVFASSVVTLLYGTEFAGGGPVLAIHIFASVFVFIGGPRGLWVTNESLARFALFANLSAAFVNVGLNVLLIPAHGIVGAAVATLLSYSVAYVLTTGMVSQGRAVFLMQLRSLLLLDLPHVFRSHWPMKRSLA